MKNPASAIHAIAFVAMCMLVQGCVGGWTQRRQAKTFAPPSVGGKPVPNAAFQVHSAGHFSEVTSPTTAWLREHWGEPTTIGHRQGPPVDEVWTYKYGRAWYGAVPCVIVPIPLILPLESRKVVFYAREGRVVEAKVVEESKNAGWIAGFTPGGLVAGSFPDR